MVKSVHQNGFTLIELMITVSILGVLATLAAGSFFNYKARAKQSEIKSNLGAIGEHAISFKAEHDTYITDWSKIGWQPMGITRYRYWYNGVAAMATPTLPEVGINYSDPGSVAAIDSFSTAAVGNIDNDAFTDQWSYDQNRSFTILQNDVTTP